MAQTLARVALEIYRKQAASPVFERQKAAIVHAVHEKSPGHSPALTDRRRLRHRSPLRSTEVTSGSPYPKYTPMLVQSSTRDSSDSLRNSRLGSEESRPSSRMRPRHLYNYDIKREAQHPASVLVKSSQSFRIHGLPSYMRRAGVIKRIHARTVSQHTDTKQVPKVLYAKVVAEREKSAGGRCKTVERKILKSEVFFQPPKVTVKRRADSCQRHRPAEDEQD